MLTQNQIAAILGVIDLCRSEGDRAWKDYGQMARGDRRGAVNPAAMDKMRYASKLHEAARTLGTLLERDRQAGE